jgi:hypothetical protein
LATGAELVATLLLAGADSTRMWACAIEGCGERTETPEELLLHQATDHERIRCGVCGTTVADGYFGLRHAFEQHSRAEYVRAYEASPEAVGHREAVLEAVEREADVEAVLETLREREHVETPDAGE